MSKVDPAPDKNKGYNGLAQNTTTTTPPIAPPSAPPPPQYVNPVMMPPPAPLTGVVVTQPGIEEVVLRSDDKLVLYKDKSLHVICFACSADVWTNTTARWGNAVWGSAFLACLVGCNLGCCLLPFCVRPLMDTEHSCPNCKIKVGLFEVVKF